MVLTMFSKKSLTETSILNLFLVKKFSVYENNSLIFESLKTKHTITSIPEHKVTKSRTFILINSTYLISSANSKIIPSGPRT